LNVKKLDEQLVRLLKEKLSPKQNSGLTTNSLTVREKKKK